MLTADLIQAYVRQKQIRPKYISTEKPDLLKLADLLISIYLQHKNKTRQQLNEALKDLIGDSPYFILIKGLAKLLDDRSQWDIQAAIDPVVLRDHVFLLAASKHPIVTVATDKHTTTRENIFAEIAEKLSITKQQVEDSLYADLKLAYRLIEHKTLSPTELLQKYNLSLAQSILLKSSQVTVTFSTKRPARARAFFRAIKFRKLMYQVQKSPKKNEWIVILDGPMSLFGPSSRYGLGLALILPSLIQLDSWKLNSTVTWRHKQVNFVLTPEDPLLTSQRLRGTFLSDEEKILFDRINKDKKSVWQAHRTTLIFDLNGEDILVPDFELRHPDGRRALVEILGYWRRSYLERRSQLLGRFGPPGLILCVSRRLVDGKEKLAQAGANILDFAHVIQKKKLLELAEKFAVIPKVEPRIPEQISLF